MIVSFTGNIVVNEGLTLLREGAKKSRDAKVAWETRGGNGISQKHGDVTTEITASCSSLRTTFTNL